MNKYWLQVFVAAFFEVFWVIGLKHAASFLSWTGTVISIIVSFYFMINASRYLSVGTVYAVFVGMGTAGTILTEVFFFGEPFSFAKISMICALLVGVVGLNIISKNVVNEGENG